ncbi:MAG: 30S ribosomal protein S7 [Verrucomicrobia bacterium]|nr:30S ribosomal protein S7 [Verrucomicrobiota bacterium]
MSRRRQADRRPTHPDSRYNSPVVSRLINTIMWRGKKSTAQKIVYGAFALLSEKANKGDPLEVLTRALENVKPRVEVKSRRVGGATYQIPVEVTSERQIALALRWFVRLADGRKGVSLSRALADEIFDAFNGQGAAVKKREDVHKMAQANRAFAHLRW